MLTWVWQELKYRWSMCRVCLCFILCFFSCFQQ